MSRASWPNSLIGSLIGGLRGQTLRKRHFLAGVVVGIIGRIGSRNGWRPGVARRQNGGLENHLWQRELAERGGRGLPRSWPAIIIRIPTNSSVAQSVEQAAVNRWVVGSSPTRGAFLQNHDRTTDPTVDRKRRGLIRFGVVVLIYCRKRFCVTSLSLSSTRWPKTRARQIPLVGRGDGRDWPQLSDSLVTWGEVVNRFIGFSWVRSNRRKTPLAPLIGGEKRLLSCSRRDRRFHRAIRTRNGSQVRLGS